MKRTATLLSIGIFIGCCNACSSDSDNYPVTEQNIQKATSSDVRLLPSAYVNNYLQLGDRFISNSRSGNRVSIIDGHLGQEIRSWNAAGVRIAFPLPQSQFEGVALIYQDKIVIKSNSLERTLLLDKPYMHVSAAAQNIAFSFTSEDGKSVEVVRVLDDGQWFHDTMEYSWAQYYPPDDPVLEFVPQLKDDGNYFAVFNPHFGVFTVFSIPTSYGGSFGQPYYWCSGNPAGTTDVALFSSFVWNDWEVSLTGRTFVGDRFGTLYTFMGEGDCAGAFENINFSYESPGGYTRIEHLLDTRPIIHIALYESPITSGNALYDKYKLGLIQDDADSMASLQILTTEANQITVENQVNNICDQAINSLRLDQTFVVVMCDSPDEDDIVLSNGIREPHEYVTLNMNTGEIINRYRVSSHSAGFSINQSTKTLYRVLDDVFGTLEKTNLMNGSTSITKGIFLRDVIQ